MQTPARRPLANPLAGLISDEDYHRLRDYHLLSERAIRDYQMRRHFREMRRDGVPANAALERLQAEYPYLQLDTIRKIVYHVGGAS
jgi:hypothetical protein